MVLGSWRRWENLYSQWNDFNEFYRRTGSIVTWKSKGYVERENRKRRKNNAFISPRPIHQASPTNNNWLGHDRITPAEEAETSQNECVERCSRLISANALGIRSEKFEFPAINFPTFIEDFEFPAKILGLTPDVVGRESSILCEKIASRPPTASSIIFFTVLHSLLIIRWYYQGSKELITPTSAELSSMSQPNMERPGVELEQRL